MWGLACIPDDVVQDHEPLKLQLQLPVGVFRQRVGLKLPQPEVCVFVAVHEQLEGAHLEAGEWNLESSVITTPHLHHDLSSFEQP